MLSDDEILDIATAAGLRFSMYSDDVETRAAIKRLARAVERAAYERAAQECDEWMNHWQATIAGITASAYREGKADAASTLAERIRALGRQHE